MNEFVCTEIVRGKHSKIEWYILTDAAGVEHEYHPHELKQAIEKEEITVVNVGITSSGKLKVVKHYQ